MAALSAVAPIIEVACRAGEEFAKLYYETLDKRRHVMAPLYCDSSQLVWNGWSGQGIAEVMQLLQKIPSSQHSLHALDCQPIPSQTFNGATAVLVSAEGQVRYESEHKPRSFTQQFMLVEQDGVWKIASDCFRFVG